MQNRILRPKGNQKIGIFISDLGYDKNTNYVGGTVWYFPLEGELITGWVEGSVKDTEFVVPREYFLDNFEYLTNPQDIKDFSQGEWSDVRNLMGEI